MYFARLNSLTVRLSRFDLAFDSFSELTDYFMNLS